MADLVRDSALGQLLRLLTRNRILHYPEEDPNFQLPWTAAALAEKELEADPNNTTPPATANNGNSLDQTRSHLAQIPTAQSLAQHQHLQPITTRTRTRESTVPYSAERFDVERTEAAERTQSAVIQPQVTSDGVTLVDWYTTDDPSNPQNWALWKKILVTVQIFLYTFAVYAGSAIYTSSEPGVMKVFGVGYSKASLGLSMYVLGYGVGPLLFSPLSELPVFGRNVPYITSFALFVILSVPTALVDNYAGLLVLRFLTGFMGSPCLATGGASMQDIYSLLKLPYGLTAWVAAAFCAPALGPLLSGFAVIAKGWRWSLWEILWMAGPVFLLMFAIMPETSAGNILLQRARRLRKLTGNEMLKAQSEIDQGNTSFGKVLADSLLKPLQICAQDPAVLFTNVYTSLIYGIYYSFFEAFPLAYVGVYGFNLGELGIVFVCICIGCSIGITIYVLYQLLYLEPDIKKNGLRAQEHRLIPALGAVFLMPVGLFWFGWTVRSDIHWIVSILGIGLYAIGAFVLFQCIFMYLPLTYPTYAASLFAANDACRSALAAGSIIFARPLYVNLGIGRGISVLAGLMVGGIVGVWLLYFHGGWLRSKSRFAQK